MEIPSSSWLNELETHRIIINDLENKHLKVDKEIKLGGLVELKPY